MKSIETLYYFVFYTIFKLWDLADNIFLSTKFRAEITFAAIKLCMIVAAYAYTSLATGRRIEVRLTNYAGLIPVVLVILSVLYFLTFSSRRKKYVEKFEAWPASKKKIWYFVVCIFLLFVIVNMFVSVKLMKMYIGST